MPQEQEQENAITADKDAAASQRASTRAARIAAIVVTRDRLALLQECIASLRAQTRRPDEIIVVDNDSSDGTRQWLAAQSDLRVIHQGNVGGAGGQHCGIKAAHARGHDWFWCMDDDTIAQPDALEKLCATPRFGEPRTGYLGSVVRWTDGAVHKMNMVGAHGDNFDWYNTVLGDKCVPSDVSTFVSMLISRRAVEAVGLPLKEFFIWSDDIEYSHRISSQFPSFHVLDSVVTHKTPANKNGDLRQIHPADVFKLRYGLRNQVCFMRRQSGASLRGLRVAYFMARTTALILKSRAPLSLIGNMASGLFFSPQAEMVQVQNEQASGEQARGDAAVHPHG